MVHINPYINFNGNAEEAFSFYRSVFGSEIGTLIRFKDLQSPDFDVADEDVDKILRITLPIGDSTLIANDVPSVLGRVSESENRSKIAITVESREEADRIFAGLTEGAEIEMLMTDSPWGSYFGMFRDKFGIEWTIEVDS